MTLLCVEGAWAKPAFSGFYLGPEGGYAILSARIDTINQALGQFPEFSAEPVIGQAFIGGLFLGGSYAIRHFYFGGELHGWFTSLLYNESDLSASPGLPQTRIVIRRIRETSNYGINVDPGVFVNIHTVLYAILGLSRGHFRLRDQEEGDFVFNEYSRDLTGYQMGLGLLALISTHVALRGAYVYTLYNRFTTAFPGTDLVSDIYKHSIRTHQFMLGLVFYIK